MDGVEFDLRLTADEQVVIHHDHFVSVPNEMLDGEAQDCRGMGPCGFGECWFFVLLKN